MENAIKLNIAILQIDLLWEDISGNLQRIHDFLNQLPKETDIAVLPEMFSTGFSMNPEKFASESGVLGLEAMKNWSSWLMAFAFKEAP
jgi:predicted amidohydrolase